MFVFPLVRCLFCESRDHLLHFWYPFSMTWPHLDPGSFNVVSYNVYTGGSRTTPHEDNSPPDKNKAQPLPTRTTIPRTIPHQDNSHALGPLPRNKTTHQDQNLYGGELSSWIVVRIRTRLPQFVLKRFDQVVRNVGFTWIFSSWIACRLSSLYSAGSPKAGNLKMFLLEVGASLLFKEYV